jgi:hypothetical protein
MTMVRGAFSKLLAPGYRKVVFDTYKERPIEGMKLVNKLTSKRAYEEDFPLAGFTTLVTKAEGGPVTYEDAMQGSTKRYTWTSYAKGFRITTEMMEDDLYGIMGNKMSKALGRSARNNLEILLHAPYNNAFDTTVNGYIASESLCFAAHTTIKGGNTISNRGSGDPDFSLPALQAALEHFHALTDEAGLPIVMVPRLVVHSIGDYWQVNQILKTPTLPGGNQNDINQVNREGLTAHLSHYLTDTDAWFVLADQHDVNYFSRKEFTFSNSDDFDTGDAKYKGMRRAGTGFSDWRGVWGSQGT